MSKLYRGLLKGMVNAVKEGKGTWDVNKNESILKRISLILYTCDLLDPVFSAYYAIDTFFTNVWRLIEFAPLVWQHRNWDYGFIYRFQIKLHEDLYKGIYKEGHHVFTRYEARKLKIVIGLYKRLEADNYDHWHHDYLDKKYGKDKMLFEHVEGSENKPGGPYSRLKFLRQENMTKEQKKQYVKELKQLGLLEEKQRQQDLQLLGKLIAKHTKKWWD